jgi:hypothetical protein
MKLKLLTSVSACVLMTASMAASAAIISINPDYYAPGTDISNATAGVTLSAYSWSGGYFDPAVSSLSMTSIFATACGASCGPFSGQNVFGSDSDPSFGQFRHFYTLNDIIGGNPPRPIDAFSLFRVDFDSATNFAQIVAGAGGEDYAFLLAFDSSNNLVGRCDSGSSCAQYLTPEIADIRRGAAQLSISSGSNNIAYLLAGGGFHDKLVQSLTFSRTVPEPATFGLFALGLMGFAALRRRHGCERGNA